MNENKNDPKSTYIRTIGDKAFINGTNFNVDVRSDITHIVNLDYIDKFRLLAEILDKELSEDELKFIHYLISGGYGDYVTLVFEDTDNMENIDKYIGNHLDNENCRDYMSKRMLKVIKEN